MAIPRLPWRSAAVALAWFAASATQAQLYTDANALFAPTPAASEYVGYHVAADGDTLAAGTSSNRRIHIFVRSPEGWTHRGIVTATYSNADTGALALQGNTLVAGNEIYVRASDGTWSRQATLPDRVGVPALDGNTLATGVAWEGETPSEDGSVYVYVRNGTAWTQQAHLLPDVPGRRELLGESIDIEGDTLVASGRGAVDGAYVFVRTGTTWSRQAKLRAPTGSGWLSVALDGNFAAVGDPGNERVHIFERTGTTWRLIQTVTRPSAGGQFFGNMISFDGGILAVGAEGLFYLYARTTTGMVLMQTIRRDGNVFGELTLANRGKSFFLSNPFDNTRAQAAGIVEAFDTPAANPARGWTSVDVGAFGVAGSATLSGTARSISGSGADIWNRADAFHYASAALTGDGAIIARLTSLDPGNSWAKFGLMFREDFAPAAPEVMALITPGRRIGMQVRPGTAELTTFQDTGAQSPPVWLMLARSGNSFSTYRSADGENWTPIATTNVAMPATIYVGYAITSHDNSRTITGRLDGVEIVSLSPPPPPPESVSAPTNLTGNLPSAQTVRLNWTDTANNENGFVIERAPANTTNFAAIATLGANVTTFDNSGLPANTAYTYRLRAFRDANGTRTYSNYSNTFTITTQDSGSGGGSLVGQDIGNVGIGGSSATSGGTITIRAGGADVWGTADSFHFYHRRIAGDFDLRVRVRSLVNTNAWAKAGIMVRDSLDPRARNIFALLTAGNAAGLQSRDAFGGGSTFTAGPWQRAPYWVRLVRSGNNFQGYISANGTTWTSVGTRSLALPTELNAGLAVCSHDTTRGTEAVFESFTLNAAQPPPPPPPPPPTSWSSAVLGSGSGSVAIDDQDLDMVATGSDIWGQSDSGFFVYRTWRGDGEIVARVDSMSTGHGWSKGGLMMRTGVGAGSANAFVNFTPANGATFQARTAANGSTVLVQQARGARAPGWLRLTRSGNTFTAAHSIDGSNWQLLGSISAAMAEDILVGFAVTSHDMAASTRAVFSQYLIRQ